MYEEYMQNFLGYPQNGYQNTYDQMMDNYQYGYQNPNMYGCFTCNQNRNIVNYDMEYYYPEIYKVIYPMVRKVCFKNYNRTLTNDVIENMVEEVYSNIEANDMIELNINLNNDVRSSSSENKEAEENRGPRRNRMLSDLIKILIIRELIGRNGCGYQNCRQNPRLPRF